MSNVPDFDALWNYGDPNGTERAFRALPEQGDLSYQLQLGTQIARAQGLQGQFEAGHQTLDAVERRLTPETGTARVRYLLERGRLFNSAEQPERARRLFLAAWDFARSIGEDGYAVDAAHMLGILDAPELVWNLQALELAESSPNPRAQRWKASLYNNLGWSYHDVGDYTRALELFEKALVLREERGDPETIRIARWSVARVLRSLNRVDEALAIQRQLAEQMQREGQDGKDGYIEEELGECLLALGRADDATPHFARAYAVLSQDDYLARHEAARLERLRTLGR